jgi:V8-like Glu-specific endopeptidase
MKWIALLLALFTAGCAEAHPPVDPRSFALRLETKQSVCSATAVAVDEIETAAHCLAHPLVSIDGQLVAIVSSHATGPDRLRVKLAGIRFGTWAKLGKARVGDHVRWYGQPMGVPYVYREGVVAQIYPDGLAIDGTICRGDSGSGLINEAGELVGVISAMTNEAGCTFILAR